MSWHRRVRVGPEVIKQIAEKFDDFGTILETTAYNNLHRLIMGIAGKAEVFHRVRHHIPGCAYLYGCAHLAHNRCIMMVFECQIHEHGTNEEDEYEVLGAFTVNEVIEFSKNASLEPTNADN